MYVYIYIYIYIYKGYEIKSHGNVKKCTIVKQVCEFKKKHTNVQKYTNVKMYTNVNKYTNLKKNAKVNR